MNLDQAIYLHAEWNQNFRKAVSGHQDLDAGRVGAADSCPLGLWLHGEGRQACRHPEVHATLVEKHAEFHREAGRVAELVHRGDFASAEAQLKYGSPYSLASQAMAVAIMALKSEL